MDIKKAIEKLNSIDAKDLKNIDLSKLKQFTPEKIKDELMQKPNALINTILIGISVVFVLYIFSDYKVASNEIKSELSLLGQKYSILNEKKTTDAKYESFLKNFPDIIPNNQLIGRISEFSEQSNVTIITFSPLATKESKFVNEYVVSLSLEAETYKDLVNFIQTIETSDYSLKVNSWSARTSPVYMRQYKGEVDVPLEAFIEVSSMELNDV